MADNTSYTPGSGVTIAAKDLGSGVLAQRFVPIVGTTDIGNTNPLPAYRPGTTYTSRSGTITTGGTAQTLMASNTARKGYRVMNLSTADLWINDEGATAIAGQPSFKIISGALYESPAFGASTAAISIFGATTAQAFQASEA